MTDQPTPNPDSDDALRVSENLVDHPTLRAILSPEPEPAYGDMANDQESEDTPTVYTRPATDEECERFFGLEPAIPPWKQALLEAKSRHEIAQEKARLKAQEEARARIDQSRKHLINLMSYFGIHLFMSDVESDGELVYWNAEGAVVMVSRIEEQVLRSGIRPALYNLWVSTSVKSDHLRAHPPIEDNGNLYISDESRVWLLDAIEHFSTKARSLMRPFARLQDGQQS